jgi:replicative DNA helicase
MIAALDSERELLGAVLVGRLAWTDISGELAADDFALDAHREVFEVMAKQAAAGTEWDGVACLQAANGTARPLIGELMAGAWLLGKLPGVHVQAVRSAARRRRVIAECSRIAHLAAAETDADRVVSDAQAAMLALLDNQTRNGAVTITAAATEFLSELERRIDAHGDTLGVPSGFPDIDRLTGGFEPGQLIVIAGRPGHGKTTLAMNLAEHAILRAGTSVLVFSLEMSRQELVGRMAASMGRLDMGKFRSPRRLDDGDWQRLMSALASVNDKPLHIDDTSALHINQIQARARAHAQRHGVQMIVVDYLGLARGDSPKPYEAVTQISAGLKAIAKELRVPVIAVAQLNRDVDKRASHRPTMSDLRDSGSVEQDADKILFVWREEVYSPDNAMVKGQAEVIVGKNRQGETGIVPLLFHGEQNRFAQAEYGYSEAIG